MLSWSKWGHCYVVLLYMYLKVSVARRSTDRSRAYVRKCFNEYVGRTCENVLMFYAGGLPLFL